MMCPSVLTAAQLIRRILASAALKSFPLVSGGKGIHVVVPLDGSQDWPEVETFTSKLARTLARAEPELYVATASKGAAQGAELHRLAAQQALGDGDRPLFLARAPDRQHRHARHVAGFGGPADRRSFHRSALDASIRRSLAGIFRSSPASVQ